MAGRIVSVAVSVMSMMPAMVSYMVPAMSTVRVPMTEVMPASGLPAMPVVHRTRNRRQSYSQAAETGA
jgi:hypothetical protein